MKRSYIFKQICNFQLQVCLSMYDLLVDTNHLAIVQKLEKKYLPSSIYLELNTYGLLTMQHAARKSAKEHQRKE